MNASKRRLRQPIAAAFLGSLIVAACFGDKPPGGAGGPDDPSSGAGGEDAGARGGKGGKGGSGGKAGKGSGGSQSSDAGDGGELNGGGEAGAVAGSAGTAGGGGMNSAGSGGTTGAGTAGTAGSAGSGPTGCGNHVTEAGEECDDGNDVNWDGCSSDCKSQCEECVANCTADFAVPSDCVNLPGTIANGPAQGAPNSELCRAALDCVYESECAVKIGPVLGPTGPANQNLDLARCYCNEPDFEFCLENDVLTEEQSGPCRFEIEDAVGTTQTLGVGAALFDLAVPAGIAMNTYGGCLYLQCREQCTAYIPADEGAGGMGGAGGASGSAGRSGSAGTGGASSSGGAGAGGVSGSAGAGTAGTGGGEPWTDPTGEACLACEAAAPDCSSLVDVCDGYGDAVAARGSAAGTPLRTLCQNVTECVRETNCMAISNTDCYCGIGADVEACLLGDVPPSGPCIDEIRAGLETNGTTAVLSRYIEAQYGGGGALRRVTCDRSNCAGGIPDGEVTNLGCFVP